MTGSVLVLAALLSAQQQALPPAPSDVHVRAAASPVDQQRPTDERERTSGERPHTVGLGSQVSMSTRGGGGGGRFWLRERLGVNVNVSWYRPRYTVAGQPQGSTFGAFPSFILMLTKPDATRDIDVRPYVGGGLSYISTPRRVLVNGVAETNRMNGTGGHAFGGVELTFKEADWMTISAEGIYYRLPVRFVNAAVVDGFNYLLAFHFYLK